MLARAITLLAATALAAESPPAWPQRFESDGNLYRRSDDGWQRYGPAPRDTGAGGVPGLGRPVDGGGYVPSRPAEQSRYVPSTGLNAGLAGGLDRSYAARQRAAEMDRRYGNWGGREFGGGFGGGRYAGFGRGGRR